MLTGWASHQHSWLASGPGNLVRGSWPPSLNSQLCCWFAMRNCATRRHVSGRCPRVEWSLSGLGNLPQRPATILLSSQEHHSDSSEMPCFLLLFSLSIFFFPHLSLLADFDENSHHAVCAADAWHVHHCACRITMGLSWRVRRVLASWQFGSRAVVS